MVIRKSTGNRVFLLPLFVIDCEDEDSALQYFSKMSLSFFSNRSIKVRELGGRAETEPESDTKTKNESRQPTKKQGLPMRFQERRKRREDVGCDRCERLGAQECRNRGEKEKKKLAGQQKNTEFVIKMKQRKGSAAKVKNQGRREQQIEPIQVQANEDTDGPR
ncbi:hypothetical protein BJ508DRAFT_377037 [Ascobolus immersus RN42]|uniref:Uncharacterized protein n=1 Tax=Ascobolus immersus RN42 TaxID=1160509 RepID=A0A3N4I4V6_ASCIM|nr:hypothetical protein BJ508DRAFT_377037 [Ascobolus immersus RN42]